MKTEIISLLQDNYAYLLIDETGTVAIIDPSESAPVERILTDRGLPLDFIINTHHHWDHTGGNEGLKKKYECKIAAPVADENRIDDVDIGLKEGDVFQLGNSKATILETPGHTSGHICLWFKGERALFCGDTLFSMGCGRLFEGTAEQMWDSLNKIMSLPDDTMIYCGHEYTQNNGNFCLTIEQDNKDLQDRMKAVEKQRKENKPTIPVSLAMEKKTNSFLRAGSAAKFKEIRKLKDTS